MPRPSLAVPLVIEPSGFRANEPPPTRSHLAREAAVPSKIFRWPSVRPGLPIPDCRAGLLAGVTSRTSTESALFTLVHPELS